MSMDGPCSVLRGGSMRGLSSFNSSGDIFSNRGGQSHPNMAVRCGGVSAPPAPAPAAPSSGAWDAHDEPLADIDSSLPDMLTAPTLRSMSSLFMSIDAAEDGVGVSSSADGRGRTNNIANSSGERSKGSAGAGAGGAPSATGSTMVDEFMSRLPEPIGTCDNLTREQSFPPPSRPRFLRDQSFPPPVQSGVGGLTVDMLPSSSSIGAGGGDWSHGGGSTAVASGSVFGGNGAGGGPSSSKFQGLGFPGSIGTSNSNSSANRGNGEAPLRMKQPSPWGADGAGGRGHPGGGTGGGSLADKEQHPVYLPVSSSHRPRRPSFDTLAGMIPGIPSSWPALSPSPSSPQTPSSSSTAVQTGDLDLHAHGGGGGGGGSGGGGGNANTSTPKVKPAAVPARPEASRPPPAAAYTSSPLSSPPSPPSPPVAAGRGRSARPGKKPKKQHLRRADSPPPARWNASPAAATNPVKKSPSSGTGKRGVEMPPSCGPVRAGGGPADREQQKRRDEKIQRYLYKRSRRKFAKFTRDASPSRSRPKAAALRPRVKGKFVKTVPDFISVNAGQQPGEEIGGGTASNGVMSMEASSSSKIAASVRYPALVQGGGGFGGSCGGGGGGGGVRSVRNGGSVNVNVNFDAGKAFSSTPSSSLMPRGVGGAGAHPPQVSALAPGAPNTMSMSWSTGPSPMSM